MMRGALAPSRFKTAARVRAKATGLSAPVRR